MVDHLDTLALVPAFALLLSVLMPSPDLSGWIRLLRRR